MLKVDTERHPELAERFGVRGIPNFVVLPGGRPVRQQLGLVDLLAEGPALCHKGDCGL